MDAENKAWPLTPRILKFCDKAILLCLSLLIFCLPFSKALQEVFTWTGIGFWTLKKILSYRTTGFKGMFPETGLNKALGLFLLMNAIATITSLHLDLSVRAFFGKELKFLAVFFMVVETISTRKRLWGIFTVLLLSALFIGADALTQYVTGVDFIRGFRALKPQGPFTNPNDFAGWLIVLIPALFGALFSKDANLLKWPMKTAFVGAILVLSLCLLWTFCRGAWLGLAIGLLFGGCYAIERFSLKVRILLLVAFFFITGSFLFSQCFESTFDDVGRFRSRYGMTPQERFRLGASSQDQSVNFRRSLWREAVHIIKDHPWVGAGLNTYSRVAPLYKIAPGGGITPHNCYLHMAAETGIAGLLSFLWILVLFFRIVWRHVVQCQSFLALGLLSGVLAFLVQSFFDTNLYALPLVVLFWFMMGLTVAIMRVESGRVERGSEKAKDALC